MAEIVRHLSQSDITTVLSILNEISVFAGLSRNQLDSLLSLLEKVEYSKEQIIFEEGDKPDNIYVVKSGRVKLVVNRHETPLELIVFGPGALFGEASVIGIQPHSATAIAIEPVELIVLSRQSLLSLYESDIQLYCVLLLNIAREVCRRLHRSDEILLHYIRRKEGGSQ